MPNWCYNEVTIEGDKATVEKLLAMVKTKDSEFDFNTVLPYPKVYADLDAAPMPDGSPNYGVGFNKGGYGWCIMNWGTKWNASEPNVSVSADGKSATISFDTAWSPSTPVTAALSVAFPELTITHKYEEGGSDFSGIDVFEDGELVNSADGLYDDYPVTPHPVYDENGDEVE